MPSFEIPDGPTTISLKSQMVKGQSIRTGTAVFSVTNKSGQPLAGRLSAQPQGDAKADWFEVQGEKERPFAAAETQKITVNVKAPPGVKVGDYKFRFRAVNVNDPDNDYTDSAVVTFNVAEVIKPPPPKFPVWAIVVAVLAVVLVGGGVGLAIWRPWETKTVAVPDVVGKTYSQAQSIVSDAGLVAAKTDDTTPGKPPGTVVSESPAKGSQLDKGSTVTLAVAKGMTVPDVRNKSFDAAHQQLVDAGFTVADTPQTGAPSGAAPNTVIDSVPTKGATVSAGQTITLVIDPGVTVPSVVGSTLGSVASNLNANFKVTVSVQHDGGETDVIASQNPASGTVAKGSPLALTVHGPLCQFGRFCLLRPEVLNLYMQPHNH